MGLCTRQVDIGWVFVLNQCHFEDCYVQRYILSVIYCRTEERILFTEVHTEEVREEKENDNRMVVEMKRKEHLRLS